MSVYLFLAEGFEEIEAISTIDVLRRAKIDCITVSVTNQLEVCGAHNIVAHADTMFDDVDFSQAQMLILPGGPGTANLEKHTGLTKLLLNHNKKGGLIAAICAAPSVLGKLHLLRNLTAVCYPGYEEFLEEAYIGKENVVASGNMITARGPALAMEFALAIVAKLKGDELAKQVADGLLFTTK